MKRLCGLLLLLSSVVLQNCGNSDKKFVVTTAKSEDFESVDLTKEMDNQSFLWEEILDSVKFIFLETKDESLVHQVYTDVAFSKNRIFIHDMYQGDGVAIFDQTGRFVARLLNGRGPGEINRVLKIAYDNWNDELLILQPPVVKRYTSDGEFIGDYYVPFPKDNMLVTKDGYVFSKVKGHRCDTIKNFDDFSIIITDKKFNVERVLLPYKSEVSYIDMRGCNDEIVFSMKGNDTIYSYKDNQFKAKYVLHNSRTKDVSNMTSDDLVNYCFEAQPFTECLLSKYIEIPNFQYIQYEYGTFPYSIFRDTRSGRTISGLSMSFYKNDLIQIGLPFMSAGNWFVSLVYPQNYNTAQIASNRFISNNDLQKLASLNEDSNPFFVLYKLKHFE